jgi:hypothetical protein
VREVQLRDDQDLKLLIEDRLLRVNAASFGLVAGLLGAALLFLATNWLVLKGGSDPGPHLGLLSQYFAGYRVTFVGSLIGSAYAFAVCFAMAYAGAWLYNRVGLLRHGPEPKG